MDPSLKIQAQIRQNAEEVSSYLSDLARWEAAAKKKDQSLSAVRSASSAVSNNYSSTTTIAPILSGSSGGGSGNSDSNKRVGSAANLTPSSILESFVPPSQDVQVPKSRSILSNKDAELCERERGNEEYQRGSFQNAVKSYTRCLGLKVANYLAFSNRAMALLKLKEYHRAEADCDCALKIEPTHVKSLQRRATARNALGKHRAALQDLIQAEELDPSNKQIRADMQKTRELLRTAVNRAPMVRLQPTAVALTDGEVIAGPDLPL